jgi:GntR family transcriptional regulator
MRVVRFFRAEKGFTGDAFEEIRMLAKPLKSPAAIPAYQRIQQAIRKKIESGQLQTGDSVPSERELAKIHKVSLMTARHALAYLERDGVVERRRGIGTFVSAPKIHFNRLTSYSEQMAGRRMVAGSKVLFAKVVHDGEAIARLLMAPKSEVLRLERLRQASGQPFALETCYLAADQFSGLIESPLHRESLFNLLEHKYGVELSYADEEVDATAADAKTAELLGVAKQAPLLRIRQVIYSSKGKAILYVLGLYRSDCHNLMIRRFR